MHTNNWPFIGVRWSKDWMSLTPWSLNRRPTKYIGYNKGDMGKVNVLTMGPIAIVIIRI